MDWIGDIGGLFDGLKIFLHAILGIVTYKMYDSYMVAQLFSVRSNKNEETGENKLKQALTNYLTKDVDKKGKEQMDHTQLSSFKMLFFDKCNKRMRKRLAQKDVFTPFRRDENYRLFDDGLKKLHSEINIVEVLR